MQALKNFLASVPSGAITTPADAEALKQVLENCWDDIEGSDTHSMSSNKLSGGLEKVTWQPPILSFTIERHGETVQGASRAETYEWQVNVDEAQAKRIIRQHQQATPVFKAIDIAGVADAATDDHISAHKHSARHFDEIMRSESCGCFHCCRIFEPSEIAY
jgi:hypothetical protein